MNNNDTPSTVPSNRSPWVHLWRKIEFLFTTLIGRHQQVQNLSRADAVIACLCLAPTIALFLLTFWHYLPVQDGWFHYYGKLQNQHEVPYRDFYYFSQPIPLLESRFLVWLSPQLIFFRVVGIFERCILGVIVYLFLRRRFTSSASFFATTIALLMYQANYSDVFYSYYQTCLLFFLLSQYCCVAALDNTSRSFYWLLGAGVFSALAFFTKQSSGAFAIIGTIVSLAISAPSVLQMLRWVIPYAIGGVMVTAPMIGFLIMNDCMGDYLLQVFPSSSSKGSFCMILFGFLGRSLVPMNIIPIIILGVIMLCLPTIHKSNNRLLSQGSWIGVGSLSFMMIIILIFIERRHANDFIEFFNSSHSVDIKLVIVHIVFFVSFFSVVVLLVNRMITDRKRIDCDHYSSICLIGSLLWMWSHGMSYVIEEHSCLPGLSFLAAVLYDQILAVFRPTCAALLMTTVNSMLIFIIATQKLFYSYSWWGWIDVAYSPEAREEIGIPYTKGFRISHGNATALRKVYSDIVTNSGPSDAVFTFPHCPIFNYIADRRQPSFAPVTYFDVCPDAFAILAANGLRLHEPKLMVVFVIPEKDWQFHEGAFRSGAASGQRAIWNSISDLTSSGHYRLMDEYSGGWGWTMQVWLRNENPTTK